MTAPIKNPHLDMRRIGGPGVNLWRCQRCQQEDALSPLRATECRAKPPTEAESDAAFMAAVEGK